MSKSIISATIAKVSATIKSAKEDHADKLKSAFIMKFEEILGSDKPEKAIRFICYPETKPETRCELIDWAHSMSYDLAIDENGTVTIDGVPALGLYAHANRLENYISEMEVHWPKDVKAK